MDVMRMARVPAVTAAPYTSVADGVKMMVANGVGAIVITDDENHVLGIFTERDNLMRVSAEKRDLDTTCLVEVMTDSVDTIPPETSVEDALTRMVQNHYRHLPIVDADNRLLGIVSVRYLLMRMLSQKQANLEILEAYVEAGGPG